MWNTWKNFWICYCMILLLQSCRTDQGESSRPYLTDPDCPRRPELTGGRLCLKKCRTQMDCKGKNKQCLCDANCGRSCVKPNKPCFDLHPVPHGRYEVSPYNTFGARVRYMCDEGYILSGDDTRVCQGDGTWSGLRPSCETEGKCKNPLRVPHASHDGTNGQTVFPMGTQLTYSCSAGFKIDGFVKAMCVAEGRWVGPRMTCSPRRCGHPEDIPHGVRQGDVFVYPHKVTYKCLPGYNMIGKSWRHCGENGEWGGTPPVCKPVTCPLLLGPPNGHRMGTGHIYDSVIQFSCLRGFRLSGSAIRTCLHNGTWSGTDAKCSVVDCGHPGPFYNGHIEYTSQTEHTTDGAIITFRCFGGATFEGEAVQVMCQSDGRWSYPVPKCWNKCKVPAITNGSVIGREVDEPIKHTESIQYTCDSGFEPINSSGPSCYNGSLSYTPVCTPKSCYERPDGIRDGMVRFYSIRHGNKAMYRCHTGYKMRGPESVVCQHGHWVGGRPVCIPAYCQYAGSIVNGYTELVGELGKYMYDTHIRNVVHNDQVEYHCNKGFKRIGPMGATCVDGAWSPSDLPDCVPGQHPRLEYMYRGKRAASDTETP